MIRNNLDQRRMTLNEHWQLIGSTNSRSYRGCDGGVGTAGGDGGIGDGDIGDGGIGDGGIGDGGIGGGGECGGDGSCRYHDGDEGERNNNNHDHDHDHD